MSTLKIQVDSELAPFTTQMRRLDKGVEQFYYVLLFTSEAHYQRDTAPWRSWLKMGFHIQTRGHPPGANKPDRLVVSVRPDGKATHIQASSRNAAVLQRLHGLLQAMEALRGSMKGMKEAARLQKLLDSDPVKKQLIEPVKEVLKRAEVRPEESESVMAMLRRGLAAFADDEISTVKLSLA